MSTLSLSSAQITTEKTNGNSRKTDFDRQHFQKSHNHFDHYKLQLKTTISTTKNPFFFIKTTSKISSKH